MSGFGGSFLVRASFGTLPRWRAAVCDLTYPHVAHPVAGDHGHRERPGHCSGVATRQSAEPEVTP